MKFLSFVAILSCLITEIISAMKERPCAYAEDIFRGAIIARAREICEQKSKGFPLGRGPRSLLLPGKSKRVTFFKSNFLHLSAFLLCLISLQQNI